MGSRFGRNQKRKLREQIAEAEARADKLENEKDECDLLLDRQGAVIRRAEELLGYNTAFLPPKEIDLGFEPHHGDTLRLELPVAPLPIFPTEAAAISALDFRLDTIELGLMRGRIDHADYQQQVHVVFKTPAGDVGYGFGPRTFYSMPQGKVVDLIATEMARYLVNTDEFKRFQSSPRGR